VRMDGVDFLELVFCNLIPFANVLCVIDYTSPVGLHQ
jgi:hypothetical protein